MQRHKWLSMQGRSDHKRPQVGATTIIHYSLNKKSAPFQATDLDIKFQCKIKVCRPPVTQLSPIGNNQNGEFEAAHSRTANLQWLSATRRICHGPHPPPAYLVPNSLSPASPTPGVIYRSSLRPSSSAPQ